MSVENKILLDPRLVLSERPVLVSELGPVNVNPYRVQANVANNNQIQFPVEQSAGVDSLLSNFIVLEVPIVVTVPQGKTIADGAIPVGYDNSFGVIPSGSVQFSHVLRSHPILRSLNSLQFKINNTPIEVTPCEDLVNLLPYAYTELQRKQLASFFPSQLDTSAKMASDPITGLVQSNQPLSTYCNSDGTSRASFLPVSCVADSANANWIITFNVFEPMLLSPLSNGMGEQPYFANVDAFSFQMSFVDNTLQNLWSGSSATYDNTLTTLINQAYLHYAYIVPPVEAVVPKTAIYTYDNIFTLSNNITPSVSNLSVNQSTNTSSLKVNVAPKNLYLSIGKNMRRLRPTNDPDVNAQIEQLTLSWGTKGTQFLTTYNAYDLYKMTMRNTGSDMSYNKWRLACNVVCIRPAVDCGSSLATLEGAVGSGLQFQFTNIQYNFNNYNQADAVIDANNWQVRMTVVSQGECVIEPGRMATNTGVITPAEALVAVSESGVLNSETLKQSVGVSGAGLFDNMKRIYHHAHHLVGKAKDIIDSDSGRDVLHQITGRGETAGGYIVQAPRRRRR